MIENQLLSELMAIIDEYRSVDSSQIADQDPEVLHQLRVKSRTLLALLDKNSAAYQDIKLLIKNSNSIRDLDVFLTETFMSLPEVVREHLQEVLTQIKQQKLKLEAAYKQEFLENHLPKLNVISERDFAFKDPEFNSQSQVHSRMSLYEIEIQLAKIESKILKPDVEHKRLHKLRLKVKKLRYQVVNFHANEIKLLSRLKYLQNKLGEFHDKDVCLQIIEPYVFDTPELAEEVVKTINQQQQTILKKIRKKISK